MGVFRRGQKLWIRVCDPKETDPAKRWSNHSTAYRVGQERLAQREFERFQARLDAGEKVADPLTGKVSLTRWANAWLEERERNGIHSVRNERAHLKLHILPALGELELQQVRPKMVRRFVEDLERKKALRPGQLKEGQARAQGRDTLAPRTVRLIYGTLHLLFADAVADELIPYSPVALRKGVLPEKKDKVRGFRAGSVFTPEEVQALVFDTRVPLDRRVYYAIALCTGMRPGEEAVLEVRDLHRDAKPLWRLDVTKAFDRNAGAAQPLPERIKDTKTEACRRVPVHPRLAELLEEWLDSGFESYFGRPPQPGDFLIPSRSGVGAPRIWRAWERMQDDLTTLGLRRRRAYATRSTFISLAQAGGARKEVLRWVTHGIAEDQLDDYTMLPYETLCEAVHCFKLARPAPAKPPESQALAPATLQSSLHGQVDEKEKAPNPKTWGLSGEVGDAGFEQPAFGHRRLALVGKMPPYARPSVRSYPLPPISTDVPCNGCNEGPLPLSVAAERALEALARGDLAPARALLWGLAWRRARAQAG